MTLTLLDASCVASWLVPGQSTAAADRLLNEAMGIRFLAPYIFPSECRSLLLKAERRGSMSQADVETALDFVAALDLQTLPPPDRVGHDQALSLARSEDLSVYDALYLKAALEGSARVASRDGALIRAAERRRLTIFDLRD